LSRIESGCENHNRHRAFPGQSVGPVRSRAAPRLQDQRISRVAVFCPLAKIRNLAAEEIFLIKQTVLRECVGTRQKDGSGDVVDRIYRIVGQHFQIAWVHGRSGTRIAGNVSAASKQVRSSIARFAHQRTQDGDLRAGLQPCEQSGHSRFGNLRIAIVEQDVLAVGRQCLPDAEIVAACITEVQRAANQASRSQPGGQSSARCLRGFIIYNVKARLDLSPRRYCAGTSNGLPLVAPIQKDNRQTHRVGAIPQCLCGSRIVQGEAIATMSRLPSFGPTFHASSHEYRL